jgi:DinB superfamily
MEFIEQLEQSRIDTLKNFDLPDEDLERSYGPGKWTVRYVLNHLSDSETVLFYRIRRIISQPKQVIWAYDQDAWARELDYASVPLELARSLYESSRHGIIHYARHHYERSGAIQFVHSETGLRTLKDEFDKVVWHNRQHLEQIERALQSPRKRDAAR